MRSSLQWMLRDGEDRTGSLPKPHGEAGRETGAVALEFAIVAPLFFMLLIAILVYGIYFTVWIGVTGAAQEGARASVAGLSPAERKALAVNTVNKILDDMPIVARDHATVIADAVQGDPRLFQVSVTYDFSSFGFGAYAALLPLPAASPTATVTVSNGAM